MQEPRISQVDGYLMMVTAGIIDFLQLILAFIPFVGPILDFIATVIFSIWFAHYGMSLIKNRPLGFLGTIIGEFIPVLDALPFWTILVVRAVREERSQSAV